MSRDLEGRVAIVTGGGRGIGRAVTLELARRGASVAVNYRQDSEAAEATAAAAAELGVQTVIVGGDVSEEQAAQALVDHARRELGPVDLLVNNAAHSRTTSIDDLEFEEWQQVTRVNLDSTFLMTWLVKDEMFRRGVGSIVNISSFAGQHPDLLTIHYGTSKAAINHFTRACARAFADRGVRVNCVAPGLTLTERLQTVPQDRLDRITESIPLGRAAEPSEIAALVVFLLSAEASYVTGEVVTAAGGRG